MKKSILFINLIWLISSNLLGQVNLKFEYNLSDFKESINSNVLLLTPKGDKIVIYQDTIRDYKTFVKGLFLTGKHTLKFHYQMNNKTIDSIDLNFNVTGKEEEISVTIDLGQNIISEFRQNKWKEIEKKNEAYISIVKYYISNDMITLNLKGNTSIGKPPIFLLTNNSNDTIFGEYLPGYFWGCISRKIDSANWTKPTCREIDLDFNNLSPLYPDSSRYATVGSFAHYKIPSSGIYKFDLLYSKTGNSHVYHEYLTTKITNWWSKEEEFYKLKNEFEIK